jgi:prophage regulatory protein
MSLENAPARNPAIRLLRLPQVCEITGLSRSSIYQFQAENRFPRAVKISERAVGWVEHEIQTWLAERLEQSRSQPAAPVVHKRRFNRGGRRRDR